MIVGQSDNRYDQMLKFTQYFTIDKVQNSRGARDSKIGKKWPESSRILDYILS